VSHILKLKKHSPAQNSCHWQRGFDVSTKTNQ
jgi:hypothetical protein